MSAMDEYKSFIERIGGAKSFVIASHQSPDGDGIGSTVALALALERMGKEVVLYNGDPIPWNLKFLPRTDDFVSKLPEGSNFDMAIMVDCAERKRISKEFAEHEGLGTLACIDHHQLKNPEADVLLIDPEAASTGEVVFRFMKRAGVEIDADVALLIYTTLVVDTGFFKYSTTNAHVLGLASELVEAGAVPWTVAKYLEESYPAERMKLLAKSLATLSFEFDGKYASMDVTQAMFKETGASIEQSDEFATYPRSIAGVEVSALFREMEDGVIKVSLRSKDLVDVAALARKMDGGGHARAAGMRMRASLDEAKRMLLDSVAKALNA